MVDSDSSKPGSRPGRIPSAPGRASQDPAGEARRAVPSAGRVVHDARGNAVWDWVRDTARFAIDSTSRLLRKLEVPELKLDDTSSQAAPTDSRETGYDPYAGSGSMPARTGGPIEGVGGRRGSGPGSRAVPHDPGGGYDPYGKDLTRKPRR